MCCDQTGPCSLDDLVVRFCEIVLEASGGGILITLNFNEAKQRITKETNTTKICLPLLVAKKQRVSQNGSDTE